MVCTKTDIMFVKMLFWTGLFWKNIILLIYGETWIKKCFELKAILKYVCTENTGNWTKCTVGDSRYSKNNTTSSYCFVVSE